MTLSICVDIRGEFSHSNARRRWRREIVATHATAKSKNAIVGLDYRMPSLTEAFCGAETEPQHFQFPS